MNQNFQSHLVSLTSHTANTQISKDRCYLELWVPLSVVFLFVQALVERKPQADRNTTTVWKPGNRNSKMLESGSFCYREKLSFDEQCRYFQQQLPYDASLLPLNFASPRSSFLSTTRLPYTSKLRTPF